MLVSKIFNRNTFCSVIFLLSVAGGFSQSADQNYIQIDNPREAVQTVAALQGLPQPDVLTEIQYYDGIGRLTQTNNKYASQYNKDLIKAVLYDNYGNPIAEYLPYAKYQNHGQYDDNPVFYHNAFYNSASRVKHSDYAFSEVEYENSPLFRVMEQGAPGESWELGSGHTVTYDYRLNGFEEVRKWTVTSTNCVGNGYYHMSHLTKNVVVDEHGIERSTFIDNLGRTVKEHVGYYETMKPDGSQPYQVWRDLETYYAYDDFGNLAWIIPPKAVKEMENSGQWDVDYLTNTDDEDLCFHFVYDDRQRLIKSKAPGADEVIYVYNNRNQVVLEQTGDQRTTDEWTFYKYDRLGRLILSGLYTNSSHASCISSAQISLLFEGRTAINFSTQYGYTNDCFPSSNIDVFSVMYYDDYDFDFDGMADVSYTVPGESYFTSTPSSRTHGFQTGGINMTLGANNVIDYYHFYNDRGELIQTYSDLYPSGSNLRNFAYSFNGFPIHETVYHSFMTNSHTLHKEYTYNRRNQLANTFVEIDGGAKKKVAANIYNPIGQLVEQNIGATGNGGAQYTGQNPDLSYLQSVDYAYNERGWLTHINNCDLVNNSPDGWGYGMSGYETDEVVEILELGIDPYDDGNGPALRLHIKQTKHYVEDISTYDPNVTYPVITSKDEYRHVVSQAAEPTIYTDLHAIHSQAMFLDFADLHQADTITDSLIFAYAGLKLTTALQGKGVTSQDAIDEVNDELTFYLGDELYLDVVNDDDHDLWGLCISYDDYFAALNTVSQYTGNISSLRWRSKTDDKKKGYAYEYDGLNRLVEAAYKAVPAGGNSYTADIDHYNLENVIYDFNGNIESMKRRGLTQYNPGVFGVIDDLEFSYEGNQVVKIDDGVGHYFNDFNDGVTQATEYTYNNSGSMMADLNKDIVADYNHLNLVEEVESPNYISTGSGRALKYVYDALGQKLGKLHYSTSTSQQDVFLDARYYMDEFEYTENGIGSSLEFISIPNGRLVPDGSGGFDYEYHIYDHLGSLRMVFSDLNGDNTISSSTEVLQEENFYPFGLEHRYAYGSEPIQIGSEHQYKYTGKELQTEFNLDWADHGARMYDPRIGRWYAVDPLASELSSWSVYAYTFNNPIAYIDLDGRFPYTFHVRAFAPTGAFAGFGYHDDGRGFSTSLSVTSRIQHSFTVDPTAGTYSQNVPFSHPTINSAGDDKTGSPSGSVRASFRERGIAEVSQEFEGSNPFYYGMAPDIEVETAFTLTENLEAGTLTINVTGESKNFPATEAFVTDADDNRLFLGAAAAYGDPTDLILARVNKVFERGIIVHIDDRGVFQSVDFDGKNYSVEGFNNLFINQDAGPFKRDDLND